MYLLVLAVLVLAGLPSLAPAAGWGGGRGTGELEPLVARLPVLRYRIARFVLYNSS